MNMQVMKFENVIHVVKSRVYCILPLTTRPSSSRNLFDPMLYQLKESNLQNWDATCQSIQCCCLTCSCTYANTSSFSVIKQLATVETPDYCYDAVEQQYQLATVNRTGSSADCGSHSFVCPSVCLLIGLFEHASFVERTSTSIVKIFH